MGELELCFATGVPKSFSTRQNRDSFKESLKISRESFHTNQQKTEVILLRWGKKAKGTEFQITNSTHIFWVIR